MLLYDQVSKRYPDGTEAVKSFSLEVQRGEFVVLIGPSGCGKSTTLRMTNRLVEPTSGTIWLDGQDIRTVPAVELRRRFGYVIQQVGLLPHLTIADNIAFVLRLMGKPKAVRRQRAEELLALARMDADVLDRYPRELSGGQQQRIGVLRALAHDPDVILMDEPFGALDPLTREQLQDELKRLQRSVQKTILFVTHDMDEALKLADRIVVMKDGCIVQTGTPEQLLTNPADSFVSRFIGPGRLIRSPGKLRVRDVMLAEAATVPWDEHAWQALDRMRRRRVNSLMVIDHAQRFAGIVLLSELQAVVQAGEAVPVGKLANRREACVDPDADVSAAIWRMLRFHLDAIPVVDDQRSVVGVVTRSALAGVLGGQNRSGATLKALQA
ncbi:MAG: ABC transporter ATP-binding protein [Alicyclobacillaceae bacterium]|nr:ABC transporter ATP-binding protein [Alicyclobacillaceae bacterium]